MNARAVVSVIGFSLGTIIPRPVAGEPVAVRFQTFENLDPNEVERYLPAILCPPPFAVANYNGVGRVGCREERKTVDDYLWGVRFSFLANTFEERALLYAQVSPMQKGTKVVLWVKIVRRDGQHSKEITDPSDDHWFGAKLRAKNVWQALGRLNKK